jgi:hypothetical protein
MRTAVVIVGLMIPLSALALPDDATLSRLLVGTWHGHRHETQYRDLTNKIFHLSKFVLQRTRSDGRLSN